MSPDSFVRRFNSTITVSPPSQLVSYFGASQLGEEDMEGYIEGGGEDAWTGFLSTARFVLSMPVCVKSIYGSFFYLVSPV